MAHTSLRLFSSVLQGTIISGRSHTLAVERVRKIYYHSGLDVGGSEGLVEVVAATDSLVVSVGEVVLDEYKRDTPVAPRYDVVYLLDGRGWYYRYSHLKEIDRQIVPGRLISRGDRVGLLAKEGGSGAWSHLHFEIVSRQPSGKWGGSGRLCVSQRSLCAAIQSASHCRGPPASSDSDRRKRHS